MGPFVFRVYSNHDGLTTKVTLAFSVRDFHLCPLLIVFTHCNCSLCSGFTIETLKRETEIIDDQLDTTVEETDLPKLSSYFDNTGDYVEMLGLSPGQQTDVIEEKARTALNRTQAGIKLALKYWLDRVLAEGTFRALLLILLSLDKGDVAIKVAQYLSDKGE